MCGEIRSHLSVAGSWIVDPVTGVRSPLRAPYCPRRWNGPGVLSQGMEVRFLSGAPSVRGSKADRFVWGEDHAGSSPAGQTSFGRRVCRSARRSYKPQDGVRLPGCLPPTPRCFWEAPGPSNRGRRVRSPYAAPFCPRRRFYRARRYERQERWFNSTRGLHGPRRDGSLDF